MLTKESDKMPSEVKLWLEENGVPPERYLALLSGEKRALQGLLSVPRRPTTRTQLEDLYRKLFFPERAGRESTVDPVTFMPEGELDRVFTAVPPSRALADYEKY